MYEWLIKNTGNHDYLEHNSIRNDAVSNIKIITLHYLGEILNKFHTSRNTFQGYQIKKYLLSPFVVLF